MLEELRTQSNQYIYTLIVFAPKMIKFKMRENL